MGEVRQIETALVAGHSWDRADGRRVHRALGWAALQVWPTWRPGSCAALLVWPEAPPLRGLALVLSVLAGKTMTRQVGCSALVGPHTGLHIRNKLEKQNSTGASEPRSRVRILHWAPPCGSACADGFLLQQGLPGEAAGGTET